MKISVCKVQTRRAGSAIDQMIGNGRGIVGCWPCGSSRIVMTRMKTTMTIGSQFAPSDSSIRAKPGVKGFIES